MFTIHELLTSTEFAVVDITLKNEKNWVKRDVFPDYKCLESPHGVLYDNEYFEPMNIYRKHGRIRIGDYRIRNDYRNFLQNDHQYFLMKCNESVLYEILVNETQYNSADPSWNEMGIFFIKNSHDDSICFPPIRSSFTYGMRLNCTNSEPYVRKLNEDYRKFFEVHVFWNPSCYGASYEAHQEMNDVCISRYGYEVSERRYHSTTMKMDYLFEEDSCKKQNVLAIGYGKEVGPICHKEKNRVNETSSQKCEDITLSFLRVVDSDSMMNSNEYFLVIESPYYYICNDDFSISKTDIDYSSFEEDKKKSITEGPLKFFHTSICLSNVTTFYDFGGISVQARCEKGILYSTVYNNTVDCNTGPDESEENIILFDGKKERVGNLCVREVGTSYSGGLGKVLSCTPFYCDGIPMYDYSTVCSGRGECIADDLCLCTHLYEGENCEDEISSSRRNYTSLILVSIFVPLSVLCCVLLFLSTFCFVICLLMVIFSTVFFCIVFGLLGITVTQRKRISRFKKLKDFEILLSEQLLEEDTGMPSLRINQKLFEIPIDEISIVSVVGSGGSEATCYKSLWKKKMVCFKCFKTKLVCATQSSFDEFEKEVQVLASLSHPNVIRFFGACLSPPRVGIVMEFCKNGEIVEYFLSFRKGGKGREVVRSMKNYGCVEKSFQRCHTYIQETLFIEI